MGNIHVPPLNNTDSNYLSLSSMPIQPTQSRTLLPTQINPSTDNSSNDNIHPVTLSGSIVNANIDEHANKNVYSNISYSESSTVSEVNMVNKNPVSSSKNGNILERKMRLNIKCI